MKKLIVILFLMISSNSWAQLSLTSNGFVNDSIKEQKFILVDVPNKTQQQLYNAALTFVTTLYVSPKDVLSTIDNEVITINGVGKECIKAKNAMGIPINFNINYTIALRFKDGKMRIDIPSINKMYYQGVNLYISGSNIGSMSGDIVIFKKNGDVRKEDAKKSLEEYFNNYIELLRQNVVNEDTNDW